MSETKLVARIQERLGDTDTVLAAASFERRGQAGGVVGGSIVGGDVGQSLGGNVGGVVGSVVAMAAGYEAAKHRGGFASHAEGELQQVPIYSTVAASATRLYAWAYRPDHGHLQPTTPIFDLDRSETVVTLHARLDVHTFEVSHPSSNRRWEFEASRVYSHLKHLMSVLDAAQPAVAE